MKPVARIKGYRNLDQDEVFHLKDLNVDNQDYSNKILRTIKCLNSKFTNCKFENIRANIWCFGSGPNVTGYINCSFDGSIFASPVVGHARFVNCSFKNVNIKQFFAHNAEFINCVFSGKLKKALFYGRPLEDRIQSLGRSNNEFHGNDFNDLIMSNIDFRDGVDLTKQIFPTSNDHFVIDITHDLLERLSQSIDKFDDKKLEKIVEIRLQYLNKILSDGQKQALFIKKDEEPDIFDLLKNLVK